MTFRASVDLPELARLAEQESTDLFFVQYFDLIFRASCQWNHTCIPTPELRRLQKHGSSRSYFDEVSTFFMNARMNSKRTKRLFGIHLLPSGTDGAEQASQIKHTFALIEKVRRGITIRVSEHDILYEAPAIDHNSSLLSTLDVFRTSTAVIFCGKKHKRWESLHRELQAGLDLNATIQKIQFPSPSPNEETTFGTEGAQSSKIVFVSNMGLNPSDQDTHQNWDDDHQFGTNFNSLARCAARYALDSRPPKPVTLISGTGLGWHRRSAITEILQREFSTLEFEHFSLDHASQILDSEPESHSGVILTDSLTVKSLLKHGAGPPLNQIVLETSSVTVAPQRSGKMPNGIFQPILFQAESESSRPLALMQSLCHLLDVSLGLTDEALALSQAIRRTSDPPELVGNNLRTVDLGGQASTNEFVTQVLENFEYYLEAVESVEMAADINLEVAENEENMIDAHKVRSMGVVEKILTHAGIGLSKPEVTPGDMICVKIDWTLTNELLWGGMEKTYNRMKRPRVHRNDRVWLAVDHTVDPRTNHQPRQQGLIKKAEKFKKEAKIIDFLPANTSIMHTDFTRERAQPGHIVVGSDSHTCSAGCMGAFAIGLGAADVVMPMVTGETWLRVPEVCRINFVGKLPFAVSGKDVVLHLLQLFKRNTIAFQRAVEYGGPGLKELSMDARFAISNMTTEFGGMGSCFEADEHTATWTSRRVFQQHKDRSLYFRADAGAQYKERRTIDLSEVRPTIALYPNPDNVVAVSDRDGMKLDGCFIGACTTTEEDLIMGALVLEAGLRAGMTPTPHGQRRVTPGSLMIVKNLERLGLLNIYRKAGFGVGAPGCSYCVGVNDVDVAGEGEVWLSSQNRNFRNRMGKGSFGNITSAAVVAASSFSMSVTDPAKLLGRLNPDRVAELIGRWKSSPTLTPETSEPNPVLTNLKPDLLKVSTCARSQPGHVILQEVIRSKVQRFAENIDTDAIIPAEFMPGVNNEALGSHCFEYYRPEFRQRVREGAAIIVAGHGFGSGSSREDAVRALQGTGVRAVIAKGFAFIYERNQLNMGLFNLVLQDEEFYANAIEGCTVTINKADKTLHIQGLEKTFHYQQTQIEETLLNAGGVLPLYEQHGKSIFRHIILPQSRARSTRGVVEGNAEEDETKANAYDW